MPGCSLRHHCHYRLQYHRNFLLLSYFTISSFLHQTKALYQCGFRRQYSSLTWFFDIHIGSWFVFLRVIQTMFSKPIAGSESVLISSFKEINSIKYRVFVVVDCTCWSRIGDSLSHKDSFVRSFRSNSTGLKNGVYTEKFTTSVWLPGYSDTWVKEKSTVVFDWGWSGVLPLLWEDNNAQTGSLGVWVEWSGTFVRSPMWICIWAEKSVIDEDVILWCGL